MSELKKKQIDDDEDKGGNGNGDDEEKEEKTLKKFTEVLDAKVDDIVEQIKLEVQKKIIPVKKTDVNLPEVSEMNTDPLTRKLKPFKKLSKSMESFVEDLRVMARGGIPQSLIKAMSEGTDTAGGLKL